MGKYSRNLPLLGNYPFITDGGLETTLIFDDGYELPEFAAFLLLDDGKGRDVLQAYFLPYIELARKHRCGFLLESPTWRASKDWGEKLNYDSDALKDVNLRAIRLLTELRDRYENTATPIVISGCLGPRGDGYTVAGRMGVAEAKEYHSEQINTFSVSEADLVSAYTLNYVEEALGITFAAQEAGLPVVISFTLETDGRLPSGQSLGDAVREIDRTTGNGPAYYMINCAHPSHFRHVLAGTAEWLQRIKAIRANASRMSHAELERMTALDRGQPEELNREYLELRKQLPHLSIFGGCCGTGVAHLAAICKGLAADTHACDSAFHQMNP